MKTLIIVTASAIIGFSIGWSVAKPHHYKQFQKSSERVLNQINTQAEKEYRVNKIRLMTAESVINLINRQKYDKAIEILEFERKHMSDFVRAHEEGTQSKTSGAQPGL